MKMKTLEMKLQQVPCFPKPRADLEQYATPAPIAADILFTAYSNGDIQGKKVADLGCGTGMFALGASLLESERVFGCDLDRSIIEIARRTALEWGLEIDFQASDVRDFNTRVDTIIQNPPFGAQKRHADRPFLEKGMDLADTIYSLHNSNSTDFIQTMVASMGFKIDNTKDYMLEIPYMHDFHSKEMDHVRVRLFRIVRK